MKSIQIKEYSSFLCRKDDRNSPAYEVLSDGNVLLSRQLFLILEDFVLSNRGTETDPMELITISHKKSIGKVITAQKYVGVICLKNGTIIEILPKVYSSIEDDENGKQSKKLLLNMLRTLRETPYKISGKSFVDVRKMNIFEIFIRMFIDEVFFIVKRGLKCSYETVEENVTFYKGKIKFSEHIKYNHSHKERSYVEYDVFSANRPENRILKTTLQFLYKQSGSIRNRNDIRSLLNSFQEIDASLDYESDFAKCVSERNVKDYKTALLWAKVFLSGKSFTSYSGSQVSVALLFSMEKLYESYIASLLKKELLPKGYIVSTQHSGMYMFGNQNNGFSMKPDVLIRNDSTGDKYVLDTKWKILDAAAHNYKISDADMYQMYAYHKEHNPKSVTLLYPKTEKVASLADDIRFESKNGVTVAVKFVDLFKDVKNLSELLGL